jgi:hypothetical protein
MTTSSRAAYLWATAFLITVIASIHLLPFNAVVSYTVVFVLASIIYLWIAWRTFSVDLPRRAVWTIAALSILLRLSFLSTTPIGSDDAYRYVWDGKVQSSGINPYRYVPQAEELRRLHSPRLPAMVNHPDMKTVYFPVSEWIFYLSYQMSGEDLWGFKLFLLLAEVSTLIGLLFLTARLSLPPAFVLLYALCPLPILSFALDAHVDGLGLPLLVFALLSHRAGKKNLSLLLFGLSLSIKPVALVLVPVLFFAERKWMERLRIAVVPAIVLIVQFLPYIAGVNPFEALGTFAKHWTFNGALFETAMLIVADNQVARVLCGVALGVALVTLCASRVPLLDKIYYAVIFLLLCSPVVHPWYVCWLTVLVPLGHRWSGIAYSAAVSLTAITVLTYKLSGVWEQLPIVLITEYLPVIVLLVIELRASEHHPASP